MENENGNKQESKIMKGDRERLLLVRFMDKKVLLNVNLTHVGRIPSHCHLGC